MARIGLILILWLLSMILILSLVTGVRAHHNPNGKLPLVPDTALIHNVWADGEVAWCVDARGAAYPGFVAQLHEVNDAAYAQTAVAHRQVHWDDGCEVRHTMPDTFTCGAGAAACIHYANWPVTVIYNWRLGYSSLRSTAGHEGTNCGHAMGEHEGYDDLKFRSHILTYGRWAQPWNAATTMDFGTHALAAYSPWGVWECTDADVAVLRQWLYPQPLGEGGLAPHLDYWFVWLGSGDPHPVRADHVSIYYWDPNGAFYYSGITSAVPRNGAYERPYVWCIPGREIWANTESASWTEPASRWWLRSDVLLGVCP